MGPKINPNPIELSANANVFSTEVGNMSGINELKAKKKAPDPC